MCHFAHGFPGLYHEPDQGGQPLTAVGECIDVKPALYGEALSANDRLEGYHGPGDDRNMYTRARVSVVRQTGEGKTEEVDAWVYFCNKEAMAAEESAVLVAEDGRLDWRAFMTKANLKDFADPANTSDPAENAVTNARKAALDG